MVEGSERTLTFRRQRAEQVDSVSPEGLFGDLPKLPQRVAPLWGHQTDQLRTYFDKHKDTSDVALELPTGSGKTLVGMLIAEWRRRHLRQRTVYACPTVQLATQAAEKAERQGIRVSLLTGSSKDWDSRLLHSYEAGEAIAVTTYSSIFNSYPKISDARTIIFDDAHAAENYVAGAWSVSIDRGEELYDSIVEVLRPSLDKHLAARLSSDSRQRSASDADVRLIPASTILRHEGELEAALGGALTDGRRHSLSMLTGQLAACCFYISGKSILIRPMVPPTADHRAFSDADQRIYLSATLGSAAELERSFGRAKIARIPVPDEWNRSGGGRRFFVFPELADRTAEPALSVGQLTSQIMAEAPKRVILGQSDEGVAEIADLLEVPKDDRFWVGDSQAGRTFRDFVATKEGTLLAANRYDGMDLANDACRLLLIDGLPSVMHEQDRFLLSRVHAGEVLAERLRARIVQGVGRCTRGPKDYSVVVITGQELTSFLSKEDNITPLPVEIQAEIRFGRRASHHPARDLPGLVASALAQDDLWQEEAEPGIVSTRSECTVVRPAADAVLETCAPHEVKAWAAAWRRDWKEAARFAIEACTVLDQGRLRAYQALWSFLAAEFITMSGLVPGSSEDLKRKELLRNAHALTARATWLREIAPEGGGEFSPTPLDMEAANNVARIAASTLNGKVRRDKRVGLMLEGLASSGSGSGSGKYEAALVTLGELLGADSFKPAFKGRTDAVWRWESFWLTIEAKSEQKSQGLLSMEYVRQANTQLKSLKADLEADSIPDGSITVIVSPRQVVDTDAVHIADEHLYLAEPRSLLGLGLEVKRAWQDLDAVSLSGPDAGATVAGIFWEHRLLPEQVRERLTSDRIH